MGHTTSSHCQAAIDLPDDVKTIFNEHPFIYCWVKRSLRQNSIVGYADEFNFNFTLYCKSHPDQGIPIDVKFSTLHKLLRSVHDNQMYFAIRGFPSATATTSANKSLTNRIKLMEELMIIDENISYKHGQAIYICQGPGDLDWYSNELREATDNDSNAMITILCKLFNSPNLALTNILFDHISMSSNAQKVIQKEAEALLNEFKTCTIERPSNPFFERMYVVSYFDKTEWALKFEGKRYLLTIEWLKYNKKIKTTVVPNTVTGQRVFWYSCTNDEKQWFTQRWQREFTLSIIKSEINKQHISKECIDELIEAWQHEFGHNNGQQFVIDILSIFSSKGAKYFIDKMEHIQGNAVINPLLSVLNEQMAQTRLDRVRKSLLETLKQHQQQIIDSIIDDVELSKIQTKGLRASRSSTKAFSFDSKVLELAHTMERTEEIEKITKVLVVLICIKEYDGDKYNELKYSKTNEDNMTELFEGRYNYDVIKIENNRCSLKDYHTIISKAKDIFNNDGTYQCIIMVWSGHGTENKLILSDYDEWRQSNYDIDRKTVETCFDGNKLRGGISSYKIFFFDACRGDKDANCIEVEEEKTFEPEAQRKGTKTKEQKIYHPDANRIIFYPNTANYVSWDEVNGGILLTALYDTMMDKRNYHLSFADIGDTMKEKTDHRKVVGASIDTSCIIEIKTVMTGKQMRKMYFRKNKTKKKRQKIDSPKKINKHQLQKPSISKTTTSASSDNECIMKSWLSKDVELPNYYDLLIKNGFNSLDDIKEINNVDDLNYIGISVKAHQLKFMNHINKLKN